MAFEFKLATDEIRETMFDFIKPVYKNTMDSDVHHINWIYGVYDSESGFFVTFIKLDIDNIKYILITENGNVFYLIASRYRHTLSEIPDELMQYRAIIEDGIKLYNNEKVKKNFKCGFSEEQEKCLNKIAEDMKDKCKPAIGINSYEDAESLFYQDEFNYTHISRMYTKNTVANFNKYMSDEKMRAIRGDRYRNIISQIFVYNDMLSEEDCKQISKDFQAARYLIIHGIDGTYEDMTFEVIKKVYPCGVKCAGYIDFMKEYIQSCIKLFPDKIQGLRSILDFINENMRCTNYKSLEFCRKELEKLIYKRVEGFQFVLTTDELREKMFNFLKPKYKMRYDVDVVNINWTTGVYDKESGIFLTKIYYLSDGVARCGVNYHSYIVIADNGNIFRVDNNDEYEKKIYDFRIPKQYEIFAEKIKEGIEFFAHNYEYRKTLSEDIEKELKVINDAMKERCYRNFEVKCEEDAKNLFIRANYNVYTIRDTYNQKTVCNFEKYASDDKILLWRGDRYLQLLKEITSDVGINQECCRIFYNACYYFRCGVSDTYDKEFLNAVRYMYEAHIMKSHGEAELISYINTYVKEYPDRIKNIVPLVEFIKAHTEDKYLQDAVENVRKLADNA